MDDEEDNKVDMGDVDFRYNLQFTITIQINAKLYWDWVWDQGIHF